MIDLASERPIPLGSCPKALAHMIPDRNDGSGGARGSKKIHISTVHRWASRGLRGVRLETICCGGVRCTSAQALQRFFERLSDPDAATISVITPSQRHKAHLRAEAELDAAGI